MLVIALSVICVSKIFGLNSNTAPQPQLFLLEAGREEVIKVATVG
jgi:metal transporter CNNM